MNPLITKTIYRNPPLLKRPPSWVIRRPTSSSTILVIIVKKKMHLANHDKCTKKIENKCINPIISYFSNLQLTFFINLCAKLDSFLYVHRKQSCTTRTNTWSVKLKGLRIYSARKLRKNISITIKMSKLGYLVAIRQS